MGIPEAEAERVDVLRRRRLRAVRQTGYRGRVGIYEIMSVTDEMRRLIARKVTGAELCAAARAAGMRSLGEDGLLKVKAGVTTPEELLRVVTDVRKSDGACSKCGGERRAGLHGLSGLRSPPRWWLLALRTAHPARLEVLSRTAPKSTGATAERQASRARCTAAARRPVDRMAVKSCYEVLEISPTASPGEIRHAFRRALAGTTQTRFSTWVRSFRRSRP